MTMRILFITPMFPNQHNVQQGIFVWELAKTLQAEGLDIRVVSIDPILVWPFNMVKKYKRESSHSKVPRFKPLISCKVKQFPRNIGMFHMYRRWAHVLESKMNAAWPGWKPQLIHSHTLVPGAMVADELFGNNQIPHVCTSHGADTRVHIHRYRSRKTITRLLSDGLYVVGVGQPIVEMLRPFAKKPGQVQCILNGMDLSKLRSANASLRNRFEGRKIILGMGNLIKTKGFDLLLKGFSEVMNDHPQWEVVIVGGGPEKAPLEKMILELGLFGRAFLTGPLDRLTAMEWMDLCDIFCLPSWSEGFGIVYIEAMACSKPVIGVANQGIDSVIRKYSTGLLVQPRDVHSITNALRQLMDNESLRRQIGEKGRKVVLEEFTWEKCAQKYLQLYQEIV